MRSPLEIVRDHTKAMRTNDVEIILSDFAENAVVLTNLADRPIVGKQEIRKLIELAINKRKKSPNQNHSTILLQKEQDDYALHVFEHKEEGYIGIETFVVKDDKIIFESSYIIKK